jgi:tartrate-resistant acid phosphatase type 5
LCSVLSIAELQQLEQELKADGSLSFLVVGDWGRRGGYNQSQVADQVTYNIISTFFYFFFLSIP